MIGIQPYIAFRGQCAEAIEFYKKAIGAEMLYAQNFGPHIEQKCASLNPSSGSVSS